MNKEFPPTPPSSPEGDGVRAVATARAARRSALVFVVLVIVVVVVVLAWRPLAKESAAPSNPAGIAAVDAPADSPVAVASGAKTSPRATPLAVSDTDAPSDDANDLANYVRPGDPAPTGAEVIGALHDLDIHTGLGAFNPPGTSPPLEGLAVPADYDLPKGYVRHHQSTDDGEPIEPILMYSPDVTLRDANGRPIAMPADRVVPIDRAPPGLPVRWVRIPRP